MSNDYNDVGKLLDHMDLSGFSYRSFRKGEDAAAPGAAPAAVPADAAVAVEASSTNETAAAPAAPMPPVLAAPAELAPVVAKPVVVVPDARPVAAATPKLRVVRPLEAAPGVPLEVSSPSPIASGAAGIGATLDRLMRGSITDSAPKLHLHLELPTRPTLDGEPASAVPDEQTLDEVFGKLRAATAVRPRAVSGKER